MSKGSKIEDLLTAELAEEFGVIALARIAYSRSRIETKGRVEWTVSMPHVRGEFWGITPEEALRCAVSAARELRKGAKE